MLKFVTFPTCLVRVCGEPATEGCRRVRRGPVDGPQRGQRGPPLGYILLPLNNMYIRLQ